MLVESFAKRRGQRGTFWVVNAALQGNPAVYFTGYYIEVKYARSMVQTEVLLPDYTHDPNLACQFAAKPEAIFYAKISGLPSPWHCEEHTWV